ESGRAPAQGHETAQEIIRFLRTHYQEPVSLADVGRAVGFSESECCRQFRQMTGDTILNYLRSYRLTRSIELLEDTRLSVSEIAYESGFSGASYYIECFKKELNQTPLQYRKRRLHTL
nr:helix-turn-helix transcriptional regulator [Lachnospiraceae bacterium]